MELGKYLEKKKKKYLIFDLDGTIAKLMIPWKVHRLPMRELLLDYNHAKAEEFEHLGSNDFTNEITRIYGGENKNIINEFYSKFELENLQGFKINIDLVNFITTNRDKYKFYIFTTNTRTIVENILKELNIKDIFEKIITKENVELTKPYPEGFYQIYDAKKMQIKELVMIGDSDDTDKILAERVGIDFFKVKMK